MKSIINYVVIFVLCCASLSWAQQNVPDDVKKQLERGIAGIEAAKTPDDFEAALKEFEGVVKRVPNWPDGHYYFGKVLPMVRERTKQAINELNHYLKLAPNAPDTETVKNEIKKLEEMRALKRQSGSIGINVVKLSDGIYVRYVNPVVSTIRDSRRSYAYVIQKGDRILSIDGKSTLDMQLEEFLRCMDGPPGTSVILGVVKGGMHVPAQFIRPQSLSAQSKMSEIEGGDFKDDVLESKIPVVLVFWTDWCPHCHRMAPLMAEMVDKYGDRIKFVNINVDENRDIAKELNIIAIPTVIFYKKGQAVSTIKGLQQAEIQEQIKKLLE